MRFANLVLLLALASPALAQFQIIRPDRPAEPAAEAEQPAEAESSEAEAAPASDPRERSRSERVIYDSSGRRRVVGGSTTRAVDGDRRSLAQTVRSINGREVPYITENERVVSESSGLKVSERVRQRYDTSGRPAGQDTERVEERTLPDGTVETTTTVYTSDMNGRQQPSERIVRRVKESNGETHTTLTTQATDSNGRFQTMVERESIERRDGDTSGTIETTTRTRQGTAGMQVTSREETVMRMEGSTAVTETQTFERSPLTSSMELSGRKVGRLTERANGSSTETVETYGFGAGSGRNLNASRMQLQSVQTSNMTVGSDGTVSERITFKERSAANPSEFAPETQSRKVSRPTADGKSVRTDTYERGINGRMTATESTIEMIEQ